MDRAQQATRNTHYVLCLGVALWLARPAPAQDAAGWAFAPPPVQHETLAVPASNGTALLFAVSVPYPRLAFAQRADGRYEADAKAIATVEGNVATVAAGQLYTTALADDYAATQDATRRAVLLFGVPWGAGDFPRYFLALQTARGSVNAELGGTLGHVPDYEQPGIGRPFVVEQPTAQERAALSFRLVAQGGAVPFDRPATLVVPLHAPAGATTVQFTIRNEAGHAVRSDTQPLAALPATLGLDPARFGVEPGQLAFQAAPADHPVRLGTFSMTAFEEGTYTIEVALPGTDVPPLAYPVDVVWPRRPASMQDERVAVDALRAIAVEDEVRPLERARGARKWEQLAAFWAERDPSPGTPFNELMAEFYARVDEAAVRFRTTPNGLLDGYQTDRGRLWVRQGPPADIARELPPGGGQREVWTYADGRRYTFAAAVDGEPLRRVE
ncbi:MAG: GWxTD domain-containing protein [Bacteroidota bacterium]